MHNAFFLCSQIFIFASVCWCGVCVASTFAVYSLHMNIYGMCIVCHFIKKRNICQAFVNSRKMTAQTDWLSLDRRTTTTMKNERYYSIGCMIFYIVAMWNWTERDEKYNSEKITTATPSPNVYIKMKLSVNAATHHISHERRVPRKVWIKRMQWVRVRVVIVWQTFASKNLR